MFLGNFDRFVPLWTHASCMQVLAITLVLSDSGPLPSQRTCGHCSRSLNFGVTWHYICTVSLFDLLMIRVDFESVGDPFAACHPVRTLASLVTGNCFVAH